MASLEIPVGPDTWTVEVADAALVKLIGRPPPPPAAGPRELVRDALERPIGFEPLRRALTPDDRVAIAIDDRLPRLGELLAGILEHLDAAGVPPERVTVVSPPGANSDKWIDELPDEFADVRAETHNPADRKAVAYLATTPDGHRIYINRTLVEADYPIILSGRPYDAVFGYGGAEAAVYPIFADDETRSTQAGEITFDPPGADVWAARAAAVNTAWLLGTPFFVQAIPGSGDTIHAVVAGLASSGAAGIKAQDARWRSRIEVRPDTVFAVVPGTDARFEDLANAVAAATRVVDTDGRVVLVTAAAPSFGEAGAMLRGSGDADRALRRLAKNKPVGAAAACLWATAAGRAKFSVAAGWDDETIETLFANPVRKPGELQRLAAASKRFLYLPDAHRRMVDFTEPDR